MLEISQPAHLLVSFSYDMLGNRITKTVDPDGAGAQPAVTTRFAYDHNGNAWADLDVNNNIQTRREYLDAVFARIGATGQVDWYLTDRLGSVRDVMNSSRTIIDHIDYDVFGGLYNETSPANGDRYKFTAREQDPELPSMQYNRGRYYKFDIGRWMSEDPIRWAAGDSNLYRYVGNNSTNRTDPSGLDALDPVWDFFADTVFGVENVQSLDNVLGDYHDGWFSNTHDAVGDVVEGAAGVPVEVFNMGRDLVQTAWQGATHLAYNAGWIDADDIYQFDLHSGLFRGAEQAGREGNLEAYTWRAARSGATFGIYDTVDSAIRGDWQSVRQNLGAQLWLAIPASRLGRRSPRARVVAEINRNADMAVEMARRAQARGRLNGSTQHFGEYAHRRFEQLNNRLNRRLIEERSSFRIHAEEFRDALGTRIPRRAAGSVGADVVVRRAGNAEALRMFDLKTHGGTPRPIGWWRQIEFIVRFGRRAEELFRKR